MANETTTRYWYKADRGLYLANADGRKLGVLKVDAGWQPMIDSKPVGGAKSLLRVGKLSAEFYLLKERKDAEKAAAKDAAAATEQPKPAAKVLDRRRAFRERLREETEHMRDRHLSIPDRICRAGELATPLAAADNVMLVQEFVLGQHRGWLTQSEREDLGRLAETGCAGAAADRIRKLLAEALLKRRRIELDAEVKAKVSELANVADVLSTITIGSAGDPMVQALTRHYVATLSRID